MTWRRAGVRAADLAEGELRGVLFDGRLIVLVRLPGRLNALEGVCPHVGGDLADGSLGRGELTCPLHGAGFDVASGAVRADPFGAAPPEGAIGPLTTYPTRVVDGEVELDLPSPERAGTVR